MILNPLSFLLLSMGLAGGWTDAPKSAETQKIVSHWKSYWGAIETLEVDSDEFVVRNDADHEREASAPLLRYSLVIGSRGRSIFKGTGTQGDGKCWSIANLREDGRQTCIIESFKDDPDSMSMVLLRPQTSTSAQYEGPMCEWLWLVMPGGSRLDAHLANGGTLDFVRGADNRTTPCLSFKHKGALIVCELDGGHDWLPHKVRTAGGELTWETTSFEKEGGLYFPAEGIASRVTNGNGEVKNTRIISRRVQLNRTLANSTFSPPVLTPGVIFRDETKGTVRIEGGPEARERLEQLHDPRKSKKPGSKIVATSEPPGMPWFWLLVVCSIASFTVAIFLRFQSRGYSKFQRA